MQEMKAKRARMRLRGLLARETGGALARLAVFVHLAGASAWAQKPVRVVDEEGGLLSWGILAGALILVCIPAFLKSKRSHMN